MVKQFIAGLLAALLGANALAMLFFGAWWYGAVPGVTETGPFNPHFVKDIGAAYLVVAAALAWRAGRPRAGQGAMAAAAAFLALHAMIHVFDAARDGDFAADIIRDFAGVFLPAILAVWLAWPQRSAAREA